MIEFDAATVAGVIKRVAITPNTWVWTNGQVLYFRSTQVDRTDFCAEVRVQMTGKSVDPILVNSNALKSLFAGAKGDATAFFEQLKDNGIGFRIGNVAGKLEAASPYTELPPEGFERINLARPFDLLDLPYKGITFTARAAYREDARPVLCAVRVEAFGDSTVRLVATDTYRLHLALAPQQQPISGSFLIPVKPILAAAKTKQESLRVRHQDGRCEVLSNGVVFSQKMAVDWRYPDVNKVIPPIDSAAQTIVFDTKELSAALRRIIVMAGADSYRTLFDTASSVLAAKAQGIGEISVACSMVVSGNMEDDEMACYSAKYVLDAMSADPVTVFKCSRALEPVAVLQGDTAEAATLRAVIMPMQRM